MRRELCRLSHLKFIQKYHSKKSGFISGFFLFFIFSAQAQNQKHYDLKPGLDIGMAIGSTALFSTTYLLQERVKPLPEATILQLKRSDINAFDRVATYQWDRNAAHISDGLAVGSVLMQSYFYFNKSTRHHSFRIGTVAFQSLMLSQGIANAMKLTLRNRPYLYNDKVAMDQKLKGDSRMSFFSAHTTTVSSMCFSFAYAHNTYMPDSRYKNVIWVSAFTLPAIQGFLRVKAGKHYPTDVITGYLVGLGSSFLMHKLHQSK